MVEAGVEGESANNQEHNSFRHNLELISVPLEANLINILFFLDGFFQWRFIYVIRRYLGNILIPAAPDARPSLPR